MLEAFKTNNQHIVKAFVHDTCRSLSIDQVKSALSLAPISEVHMEIRQARERLSQAKLRLTLTSDIDMRINEVKAALSRAPISEVNAHIKQVKEKVSLAKEQLSTIPIFEVDAAIKQAKESLSLAYTSEVNALINQTEQALEYMLIALTKAILSLETKADSIVELLCAENSVLNYIIKSKPGLLEAAQRAIRTTENPVITEGEKTYLLQQVILNFALTTPNFELIDTIVQDLFQQRFKLTEDQDVALQKAAQQFINGFRKGDAVDLHTIHAIGSAYQAGRLSHRPENTKLAQAMEHMDADTLEQTDALTYLTAQYTSMTLGENASCQPKVKMSHFYQSRNVTHVRLPIK